MNCGDGLGLACGEDVLCTDDVEEEEEVLVLVGVWGGV